MSINRNARGFTANGDAPPRLASAKARDARSSARSVWLANSLHLSASAGSASAFQPRAQSSHGAPSPGLSKTLYESLAFSLNMRLVGRAPCSLLRAPHWAGADLARSAG